MPFDVRHARGLDDAEAARRLSADGPNALPEDARRGFFGALLRDPDFQAGTYSTGFLTPERLTKLAEGARHDDISTIAAAIAQFQKDHQLTRSPAGPPAESAWKRSGRPGGAA